ncbi:MAG: PQQ-binding-like beta-propeller repeat protein, partial [Phycisphaerales bacterium]
SSVNAVVTSGGRIFTIFDEGVTGIYKKVPQDCKLIARDAANGVLLWKMPMRQWQPEFGTGLGNRWNIHHTIPRRLIAEGNRVYVTLGFLDSPVSVLDAATGRILTEALEGTKGTDEMVLCDGILITKITNGRSVGATARVGKEALHDTLAAVDVTTGRQLWRKEDVRVIPYALSALNVRAVYHNLEELVCLNTKTGDEIWRVPNMIGSTLGAVSTLVITDDVVLFHGHGPEHTGSRQAKGKKRPQRGFHLTALSLDDGDELWSRKGHKGQAAACTQPSDLFVAQGTVWCGGSLEGYDLRTGKINKKLEIGKLISPGHHYRCHRSKATERYLIWPKRGAEFVDLEGSDHMRNDWLRAPCFTGATPANGLLYIPSDQCFCYPGVKIFGYMAMSAEPTEKLKPATDANIQRGSAYGKIVNRKSKIVNREDWPMYRRDGQRSGSTQTDVHPELNEKWEIDLACQGSQPVIVGNRLWVAEKDVHRIRCLNTTDGRDIWSFTAGGRIDSTPTVYEGLVLFGCRDGSVYCLRA